MDYSSVNYLAVLVCGIIAFAIGALWYSPVLFSKPWQKEAHLTDDNLKGVNMVQIFGTSLVLMIIMILGLAVLLGMSGNSGNGFMSGFTFGLWTGIFFISTSYGVNLLYQRKSVKLWLIDSGYQVLFLAISGGILSIW